MKKPVPNPLPCPGMPRRDNWWGYRDLARMYKRCHGTAQCCNCSEGLECYFSEVDSPRG